MAANDSAGTRPVHGFTHEILALVRSASSELKLQSRPQLSSFSLDILPVDQLRLQLQIQRSSGLSLLIYTKDPCLDGTSAGMRNEYYPLIVRRTVNPRGHKIFPLLSVRLRECLRHARYVKFKFRLVEI